MSDTLYLQIEKNVKVRHPHVYLQDVAQLSCSNPRVLNRCRVLPVLNLRPRDPGQVCAVCRGSDPHDSEERGESGNLRSGGEFLHCELL